MKTFPRIASLLLAFILGISLMVGCGQSATTPAPSTEEKTTEPSTEGKTTEPSKTDEPVELRFSWWGSDTRHKPFLAAFEKYKELNPNVTVNGEFQGFQGYKEKLLTQLAGGMEPDIMAIDPPWYPELASKGDFFVDINSKPNLFNYSDMDQNIIRDYGTFQDKLIGIPMGYNNRTIIINDDLAKKVGGLNYGERYTWETLYEDGKKIHKANPDVFLAAPDPGHLLMFIREILKQMTGKQLYEEGFARGFEEADLLYAFEWISKCYKDGVFQPLGEAGLFEGKVEQNPLWVNGKMLMSFEWTGGITRYIATMPKGSNPDVIPYLQHENKKDGASLLRPIFLFSVSKNSKNVDAALTFMNWLLNDPEAGVLLESSRATPSTSAQMKAVQSSGGLDPRVIKATQQGMENSAAKENAPSTNAELDQILKDAAIEVAFGKITPADSVAKTIPLLDKKCAELKAAAK